MPVLTRCMDIEHLDDLAERFVARNDDSKLRVDALCAYKIAFKALGKLPGPVMEEITTAFMDHAKWFMRVAEEPDETPLIRIHALHHALGLQIGLFSEIAETRRQYALSCGAGGPDPVPFIDMVNTRIDFPVILDRLIALSEREGDHKRVRRTAIGEFSKAVAAAEKVFGVAIDRNGYNSRFRVLAERDPDPGIRTYAIDYRTWSLDK
jgi:hypothetical protein